MTSVGYGDISPTTGFGKMVGSGKQCFNTVICQPRNVMSVANATTIQTFDVILNGLQRVVKCVRYFE